MALKIEYTISLGEGQSPFAVHDKNGALRFFRLVDGMVEATSTVPELGLYGDLTWKFLGKATADSMVSHPCLKRMTHLGAYGFWSAEGDHRFIMYLMPTDISEAFVDGSIKRSIGSEVSSLSATVSNIGHRLLHRTRAFVTPGSRLDIAFTLGDEEEIRLGVFYVDSASMSYPDEQISVNARNSIGKYLKEQSFDENSTIDSGSLHDNMEAIMEYAGIESYFIGDPGINKALEFEPNTTLLDGLKYAFSLLADWKIDETLDGVVGVAHKDDARFDRPGVYIFKRDKSCWGYSMEYDDSDSASRVCVYSKATEDGAEDVRVYVQVPANRWWSQPEHRTTYIQTTDGATEAQALRIAQTVAESLAISGRTESFVGLFTPQLVIGDEVRVESEDGDGISIGTVTDISHCFGRSGFYTQFTVDSGGRKAKARLKDLIETATKHPDAFTGIDHDSPGPAPAGEVTLCNTLATELSSAVSITADFPLVGGSMVVASLVHRSALGSVPEGWTLLYTSQGVLDSGITQYLSVFYASSSAQAISPVFTQQSAGRMYLNLVSLSGAGTPYVSVQATQVTYSSIDVRKNTPELVLWNAHRILWTNGNQWTVDGLEAEDIIHSGGSGRLLTAVDKTNRYALKIKTVNSASDRTEYMAVAVPAVR